MKLKIINLMVICCAVITFATSCTPKVKIKITDKNEVFVDMDITHTDSTKRLIKSLNNLGGDSMFEGKEEDIENIKGDDGVEIIHLKKSSSLDVSAKFKFTDTDKLNSSMLFVNKDEQKLIFMLNRNTINSFFEQMSQEDKEYLDLLMAPSLQNTKMSEEEYIALIASAYGNKVSQELKFSGISLLFEVPKKIKTVQLIPQSPHTINGNRLEVSFPVTKVLVLDQEIKITIDYSN